MISSGSQKKNTPAARARMYQPFNFISVIFDSFDIAQTPFTINSALLGIRFEKSASIYPYKKDMMQISAGIRKKFRKKVPHNAKTIGKRTCVCLIDMQQPMMEDLNYEKRDCEN